MLCAVADHRLVSSVVADHRYVHSGGWAVLFPSVITHKDNFPKDIYIRSLPLKDFPVSRRLQSWFIKKQTWVFLMISGNRSH